jgi:translocation and assembly module TamA
LLLTQVLPVQRVMAQKKFFLSVQATEQDKLVLNKSKLQAVHKDSASAILYIKNLITGLHKQSYMLASADSLFFRADTVFVSINVGDAFKWASLKAGNVGENILTAVGYREKLYHSKQFSYQQVALLEEEVLRYSENQGYPFASIYLDSVQIVNHTIAASLHYQTGPYIRFDTVIIEGTARFKQKYLAAFLRIGQGQPFSQQKLERAGQLLRQTPYLTINKPASVIFKNDRAYPVFFADERRASEIDGIVGFMPNEQRQSKLLITGELNLQLRNLFRTGKAVGVKWQQIRQASPRLHMAYEHPALFNTPFILGASFDLLKEDSTFLSINRYLSLAFHTGKAGKVQLYSGLKTSRLGNNAQYKPAESLPEFSDFNLLYYGIGYHWHNLDNYFYPARGVELSVDAWAGNKKILKNPFLEQTLYEKVSLSSVQFSVKGHINKYFRLSPRSVLLARAEGGKVINPYLFRNDLFRIGGLTSLRGFNENFFFASGYGIVTTEYRFFMEPTSYLFVFYDQAYIDSSISNKRNPEFPSGAGAGVSFNTNSGIFSLVYSLSQSDERALGFNFSKIHFGFTSRF